MADKNFVCTICSQTFTRMWRGKVHNTNLHGGQGEIVRLIDYMVGRLNGRYLPGNPSDYRKKNRGIPSSSANGGPYGRMGRRNPEVAIKDDVAYATSNSEPSPLGHQFDTENGSSSDQLVQLQEATKKLAKLK